jgi:PAS domain S-box-containing protein
VEIGGLIKAIKALKHKKNGQEQYDPPALSLDDRGMIIDCSKSFGRLFGFHRSDLVWHHVSTLFPQLEGVELVQGGQVNSFINYLCRCGQVYQAKNRSGDMFSSHLSFVRIEYNGKRILRMIVHPLSGRNSIESDTSVNLA